MRKQKIYISGAITGVDNYQELFQNAEDYLNTFGTFEVVNPVKGVHNHDLSWQSYMREDIKILMDCDAIYMLKNWGSSKGANIELKLARDLGMKILTEK